MDFTGESAKINWGNMTERDCMVIFGYRFADPAPKKISTDNKTQEIAAEKIRELSSPKS